MAKKNTSQINPMRSIIALGIIILILFGTAGIGALMGGGGFTPKFALDLAGGTEIILTPKLDSGEQVSDADLDQAIAVIRQRVDASGVAEAEITKQGGVNIVVGIPGERPSDETVELISKAAKMNFRPVILSWAPMDETNTQVNQANLKAYIDYIQSQQSAAQNDSDDETDTNASGYSTVNNDLIKGEFANDNNARYSTSASSSPKTTKSTASNTGNQEAEESASLKKENAKPLLTEKMISDDKAKNTNSAYSWLTKDLEKQFKELNCLDEKNRKGGTELESSYSKAVVTCDKDSYTKYLLGPVTVKGNQIANASSGLKGTSGGGVTNERVVNLKFTTTGDDAFINSSATIKIQDAPRNEFAITLDGLVISAPSIQPTVNFTKGSGVEISGGTGGFTQEQANLLANQLSFGALPLNFQKQSQDQVSASLGSEQLEKGLLAGIFGLLLVVLYSFIQYQVLGLVTVGSLGIAAMVTYGTILVLSWIQGYRLSLPSIIGVIVAIGVTADSFIVYFERLKDEIRDGRTLDLAIARAWKRAIRTIIASDTINFICAVVLYFLAVGGVRGFAFTLGLTTLIDLVVVVLFTHPIVYLLAQIPFFRFGHSLSGLSPKRLGAHKFVNYAVAKHNWIEQKLLLQDKFASLDNELDEEDEEDDEDEDWSKDDSKSKKVKKDKKSKAKSNEIDDDGWGADDFEDKPKKIKKEKVKKEKPVKKEKAKKVETDNDFDGWGE